MKYTLILFITIMSITQNIHSGIAISRLLAKKALAEIDYSAWIPSNINNFTSVLDDIQTEISLYFNTINFESIKTHSDLLMKIQNQLNNDTANNPHKLPIIAGLTRNKKIQINRALQRAIQGAMQEKARTLIQKECIKRGIALDEKITAITTE